MSKDRSRESSDMLPRIDRVMAVGVCTSLFVSWRKVVRKGKLSLH